MIDLNNYPLLSIFLVSVIVILAASEIGRRLGVSAGAKGRENVSTLEAGILGLLALMIGFTSSDVASGSICAAHMLRSASGPRDLCDHSEVVASIFWPRRSWTCALPTLTQNTYRVRPGFLPLLRELHPKLHRVHRRHWESVCVWPRASSTKAWQRL